MIDQVQIPQMIGFFLLFDHLALILIAIFLFLENVTCWVSDF